VDRLLGEERTIEGEQAHSLDGVEWRQGKRYNGTEPGAGHMIVFQNHTDGSKGGMRDIWLPPFVNVPVSAMGIGLGFVTVLDFGLLSYL
jgi:hypothetical protein